MRRASPNDSILWTVHNLGIARGGAGDTLIGSNRYTHVNLGSNCATGAAGQNYTCCTVGGGASNSASNTCATVGGGYSDNASGTYATAGGGYGNTASNYCSTVGGGQYGIASNEYATVGGGYNNAASDFAATVGGGGNNKASGWEAAVGGGLGNKARGSTATVGGGNANTADSQYATVSGGHSNSTGNMGATVGGGESNSASNLYATVGGGYGNSAGGGAATVSGGDVCAASGGNATVGGGYADTAAASYSFAVGSSSVVPNGYSNSAAFNGTRATAANQLRCGTLSKAGGSFTIDDPIDPQNKILNHYFVESPDMSNLYSGSVVLDANGRAEVRLPDYFDALNRNPRAQLTGVGSSDVYVAEDISANRFVIGGKPGIKVYWQVTGDRKDQSAEVIRTMMPVEQPKSGALAGCSLDDDFLAGCMQQLEQMGKAGEFSFRTAAGRQRYENMLKHLREAEQHRSAQPVQQRVERKQLQRPSQPLKLQ